MIYLSRACIHKTTRIILAFGLRVEIQILMVENLSDDVVNFQAFQVDPLDLEYVQVWVWGYDQFSRA